MPANAIQFVSGDTRYVCGQCGQARARQQVVIVSEDEFSEVAETVNEMARPAVSRRTHACGFMAIRCREHYNSEVLAFRAVKAHLARVAARRPYV